MENLYALRIGKLRELMNKRGWDAVIITGSDPHSSEYPALRWKQVEWLSGFTGEAGDLVVTLDHAGLWTDTRYFIQANTQLAGTGIELHKTRVPEQVLIPTWLAGHFGEEKQRVVIAVDGLCQSVGAIRDIEDAMIAVGRFEDVEAEENGFRIASVPDLLEELWGNRPSVPLTPVSILEDCFAGESRESKLEWLIGKVRSLGCDSVLLTSLDEIAWILNVRGSDIEYNPLVISYLLVSEYGVEWFVRKDGFDSSDSETVATFKRLQNEGINIRAYDDVSIALAGGYDNEPVKRLYIDPSSLNYELYHLLKLSFAEDCLVEGGSLIALRKAIKNSTEISRMKDAHIYDGVAMEKFLYWLEAVVKDSEESGRSVDEWDAAKQLGMLRSEIADYVGDSFQTISAYGAGAALPHYVTPQQNAPQLHARGMYLVDSGGQYLSGTTDITRTVPLGPCTMLEKEDYTLVLKGHIALAMAVFPKGTAGCQIDALAREPLWKAHRSFGHGTGHGVGFYLGVHEGPQDIRQNFNRTALAEGMITSDEPGIYREGMHGVRHENLLLCVNDGANEFGEWLKFEPLTLCHFDTSAVIVNLLTEEERCWLNNYNALVYRKLAALLPPAVAAWLEEKCQPI